MFVPNGDGDEDPNAAPGYVTLEVLADLKNELRSTLDALQEASRKYFDDSSTLDALFDAVVHNANATQRLMMASSLPIATAEMFSKIEFVVCPPHVVGSPLTLADNMLANCFVCGVEVEHRPHAPAAPPRLCMPCFQQRAAAEHVGKHHIKKES